MRRDPRFYDARRLAAEQSDIPSQQIDVGIDPYYNSENVEVFQTTPQAMADAAEAALTAKAADPAGDMQSFTRYVYDSRPPMSRDFVGPLNDGTQSAITLFPGTFTVPQGFIGVVRRFHFTTSANFFTMSPFGVFDVSAQITLLRNGVPIPGMTNMNVGQWGMATVTIPCFVLLNGGDTISGQWNNGLVFFAFGCGFVFEGQLLIDDGRNLPLQSGNLRPEPVVEVSADAVGDVAPTGGPTPAAGPMSQSFFDFNAPNYPGPLPPAIGVNTYLANLDDWHRQVRSNYLALRRQYPNATINVRGNSGDAQTPHPAVG